MKTIEVTQQHIDDADHESHIRWMMALALRSAGIDNPEVIYSKTLIGKGVYYNDEQLIKLQADAMDEKNVKPFSFVIDEDAKELRLAK